MAEEQISSLSRHKIAILIDGDNATPNLLPQMLVETGKYGLVTVRRIYGDWTKPSMNGWKEILNYHAIQPVQQFRYTIGKNATDSAMIIDAMDIMHTGVVDGFCLVSSDSDYTRLATRIRETGVFVMGIGEKKTPKPFVNACDVFVYTENLVKEQKATRSNAPKRSHKKKPAATGTTEPEPESESEAAAAPGFRNRAAGGRRGAPGRHGQRALPTRPRFRSAHVRAQAALAPDRQPQERLRDAHAGDRRFDVVLRQDERVTSRK
jgi:hypothetical protein